jgi:N6-L-threonylcarbamoyladenine synthase
VAFPYLLLLVSGGHCQILQVAGVGQYKLLGETLDDAVGESFDKLAKMLDLGMPGGPKVEQMARGGNKKAFELPNPLQGRPGCDFSFSGLKTAVKNVVDSGAHTQKDICATFQHKVRQILLDRLRNGLKMNPVERVVIAGGVAANLYLREGFEELAKEKNIQIICPPVALCTDNAAMIAWAGLERLRLGMADTLDFKPKARWPLAAGAEQNLVFY